MSNFEQRPPLTPPVPPTPAPTGAMPPPSRGSGGEGSGVTEQGKQVAGTAAEQGKQVAGTAAEQGREVAHTAAEGAQQVAGEAVQEIKDVARTATDEARRLVDEATGELRSQASSQTERLAEGLRGISGQLQKAASGEPLEAGPVRDLAEQAGSTFDQVAQRLQDGGIEGIADDVSGFARRRPGVFLAGAATLGFLAGRVLRGAQAASQDQQGSTAVGGGTYAGTTGTLPPPLPPAPPLPSTSTSAPRLEGATADATGVVVIDDGDAVGVPSSAPSGSTGGRR